MSSKTAAMIHCKEESLWKAEKDNKVSNCSKSTDLVEFKKRLTTSCHLKNSCKVDITGLQTGSNEECGDNAFVFIQVPCEIERNYAKERLIFGLFVGCSTVFIFLYTVVFFDYVKTVQKNLYVDWDVKTITAGDYSIEFNISPEAFNHWREHYCDENNLISESG
jgi:hypothetical protein